MPFIEIHTDETDFRATTEHVSIGRSHTNDLRIDDHLVSGSHAEIYAQDGRWMLRDLNSKNGTYLGGQRIKKAVALQTGTVFSLSKDGPRLFIVASELNPAKSTPSASNGNRVGLSRLIRNFVVAIFAVIILAFLYVERERFSSLFSSNRSSESSQSIADSGKDPSADAEFKTIERRDRVATREELRGNPLGGENSPKRWSASSLHCFVAGSSNSLKKLALSRHPAAGNSSIIAMSGPSQVFRFFIGVQVNTIESPIIVEYFEQAHPFEDSTEILAVGNTPDACVLLCDRDDRRAATGESFRCYLRMPQSDPTSTDMTPRLPSRTQGLGSLVMRERPKPTKDLEGRLFSFSPAPQANEPSEMAVIEWKNASQSMRSLDVDGTPVPSFSQLDGVLLFAGRIRLTRTITPRRLQLDGMTLRFPKLEAGMSLPALGGNGEIYAIGARP